MRQGVTGPAVLLVAVTSAQVYGSHLPLSQRGSKRERPVVRPVFTVQQDQYCVIFNRRDGMKNVTDCKKFRLRRSRMITE